MLSYKLMHQLPCSVAPSPAIKKYPTCNLQLLLIATTINVRHPWCTIERLASPSPVPMSILPWYFVPSHSTCCLSDISSITNVHKISLPYPAAAAAQLYSCKCWLRKHCSDIYTVLPFFNCSGTWPKKYIYNNFHEPVDAASTQFNLLEYIYGMENPSPNILSQAQDCNCISG